MKYSLKPSWPRVMSWVLAAIFVIYMVLIPIADPALEAFREPRHSSRELEDLTLADKMRLRSTEAITAFWFIFLGATIGSFLNVVVYRVPRGESVIFKRSRCPACGSQIAGRDNVPILGWLMLKGKCRACGAPISVRYPLVESITAIIFLLLYFVELLSGGANIPVRRPNSYTGVVWIIFYTQWDLIGIYLFHCYVFSTLLSWMLIQFDGNPIPFRTQTLGILLAFLFPALWPHLLPVPFAESLPNTIAAQPALISVITAGVGGTAAFLLSGLLGIALSVSRAGSPTSHRSAGASLILLGVSLGWQAVTAIFLLSTGLQLTCYLTSKIVKRPSKWPAVGNLFIAALIHHILWRWIVDRVTAQVPSSPF